MSIRIVVAAFLISLISSSCAQDAEIRPGAWQTHAYFPLLHGKSFAVVANQGSLIEGVHLVDSLVASGLVPKRIFSPEHGFRGTADAGERVVDGRDEKTGLKIISLYGSHKKPRPGELEGIDLMLFDLQDVGVRFYTYISTLHYVMEACAEAGIPVLVLDRPNPNGFYIDGPVLEKEFQSFVGMHPVPVVYGMTIGEYARMINGEGWLENQTQCELQVIPCQNYTHQSKYSLPVPPSPNLRSDASIMLYPSLCFFEGTIMSVGRGTDFPFECYGHPDFAIGSFRFTPKSVCGARHPKYENQNCYGAYLHEDAGAIRTEHQLNLQWLIGAYNYFKTDTFFNAFFDKLAGTKQLRLQILQGLSEAEIRESWADALQSFADIRRKYLLYPD